MRQAAEVTRLGEGMSVERYQWAVAAMPLGEKMAAG